MIVLLLRWHTMRVLHRLTQCHWPNDRHIIILIHLELAAQSRSEGAMGIML